jgi:hypothetical protein
MKQPVVADVEITKGEQGAEIAIAWFRARHGRDPKRRDLGRMAAIYQDVAADLLRRAERPIQTKISGGPPQAVVHRDPKPGKPALAAAGQTGRPTRVVRLCSVCRQPGHRIETCPDRTRLERA